MTTNNLVDHCALMQRRRRWALHAAQSWSHGALPALALSDYRTLAPDAPAGISQRDLLLALETAFDHGCFEAAVSNRPAPNEQLAASDPMPNTLIWSYEHRAWWKSGRWGYTTSIDQAGRFSPEEAGTICATHHQQLQELAIPEHIALAQGPPSSHPYAQPSRRTA
jgi:hypothetical protein